MRLLVTGMLCACKVVTPLEVSIKLHTGDSDENPQYADPIPTCGDEVFEAGTVWAVGPKDEGYPYNEIQDAIGKAADYDTICVAPGEYEETLVIDKPLVLMSSGTAETTIVDAHGSGPGLTIKNVTSDGLRVQGFTFTGGRGAALVEADLGESWWDVWEEYGLYRANLTGVSDIIGSPTPCASTGSYTAGGGIHVQSSRVTLVDVDVTDSQACEGGGAWFYRSVVTWTGGEVTNNDAGIGAGIAAHWAPRNSRWSALQLQDLEIFRNGHIGDAYVETVGGGVALVENISLAARNVRIVGNAANAGGGLYAALSLAKNWTGGRVAHNTAEVGGGIYVTNSSWVDMKGAALIGNQCETVDDVARGGAAYVGSNSDLTLLEGSQISSNRSASQGGGVYVQNGSVTGDDLAISFNYALDGGALFCEEGCVFKFTNSNFSSNHAMDGDGGAILTQGIAQSRLSMTLLDNNSASGRGGAVAAPDSNIWLEVDNTALLGNSAAYGGAIYQEKGAINLDAATIVGNSAAEGAGVYLDGGKLLVLDSILFSNRTSSAAPELQSLFCASGSSFVGASFDHTHIAYDTTAGPSCDFTPGADGNTDDPPDFVSFGEDEAMASWDLHLCVEDFDGCLGDSMLLDGASDHGDPGAYGRAGDHAGPPDVSQDGDNTLSRPFVEGRKLSGLGI